MPTGLFAGLKDAPIFTQGNYLDVGIYDVRIIRCLVKQTQRSGIGFIAELEILTSTNPKHSPGTTASWFQGLTKNQATAFGAIKEFVVALYGLDPKADGERIKAEVEPNIEAIMNAAVGVQNILAGRCVHLETFTKKTREKGLDFTVHRWTPFEGDEPPPMAAPPEPPRLVPPTSPWGQPQGPVSAGLQAAQYGAPPAAWPPTPPQPAAWGAPPPRSAAPPQPVWNPATNSWVLPR
jgi:hypothetical protein